MGKATIAKEFYKLRNEWEKIETKDWKLALWVVDHPDIDIVDHFMDIEQSPIGVFKDIFFRFNTRCHGDFSEFERKLWEEYISWFEKPANSEYDMILGLVNDGFLKEPYLPQIPEIPTAEMLWKEFNQFKNLLGLTDYFILYFPLDVSNNSLKRWFQEKIKKGIPAGIRLVSMDISSKRKLSGLKALELFPKLKMAEAIKNEMDKEGGNYKPTDPTIQFNKQLRKVMETMVKNKARLSQETEKLISIAQIVKGIEIISTAYLVSANVFYTTGDKKKGFYYIDKAIELTEKSKNDIELYPNWKSAVMLKAALLIQTGQEKESIALYKNMAETALIHSDLYTIMESYRLAATIEYKLNIKEEAWEDILLSLQAGSHLSADLKRQSTFLISAGLAHQIALKDKTEKEQNILIDYLQEWIGKDWKKLVASYNNFNSNYLEPQLV